MNLSTLSPLALIAASMLATPLMAQSNPSPAAPAVKSGEAAKPEAKSGKLTVGDPAPALTVASFVKGDEVKAFEKGKVYVVEFWATWCGPCIKAFPHLSELQAKHKEKATFIGVNVWENYDEKTEQKIKDFVAKQGDKMAYTVAYDGPDGKTDQAYMKAAGKSGIPAAFIVDKEGKIAWIGHPASMDSVLEQVIAGTYDIKAAAEKAAKAEKEAAEKARAAAEKDKALKPLREKAQAAADSEDWDGLVKALDEMAALDPERRGQFLFSKYNVLVRQKKDYKAAFAMKDALLAEKFITGNSQLLNEISWRIVDPAGDIEKKDRDLDFAMAFAVKANEAAGGKSGAILDTLARVHWEKGDKAKAIEFQEAAVKALEKDSEADDEMKNEIKATLEQFKKDAK